jgi:aminoglycoside phosphotransferase (APT) family kinase protein
MTEHVGGPHATVPLRPGDALDAAALAVWLQAHASALLGRDTEALTITPFRSGFSNLTALVRTGAAEVVLRRPPRGVAAGVAHDVRREFALLQRLFAAGVPVPEPLMACDDVTVLGSPFFLMRFVPGVILRDAPPAGTAFTPADADALASAFVAQLAALHALDVTTLNLGAVDKGPGYVARQVHGWTARWQAARTRDVPIIEHVAAWLAARQPADAGHVLLHNDFKYDNLVLDPVHLPQVRAILDWEMATVGCPLMDLGTTLAYWVEAEDPPLLRTLGLGITTAPGTPSRRELVARYSAASGRAVPDPVFYYVYGVFKLAVVAQQIFARHERGLTTDPRFGRLGEAVALLGTLANRAIETGQIGAA